MPGRIQSILVPHDFSPQSDAALARAEQLAELTRATVHVLHVLHPPMLHASTTAGPLQLALPDAVLEGARLEARELLREIASHSQQDVVVHVAEGRPTDLICEVAEQVSADLIVMGTHGRKRLAQLLLGSVAERTLRQASCPVLTVRAPSDAA